MARGHMSVEEVENLQARYLGGETPSELALAFGISKVSVYYHLKGMLRPRGNLSKLNDPVFIHPQLEKAGLLHITPEMPEFAALDHRRQALVYAGLGWSLESIMDEFDIEHMATLRRWLDPAYAERQRWEAARWQANRRLAA